MSNHKTVLFSMGRSRSYVDVWFNPAGMWNNGDVAGCDLLVCDRGSPIMVANFPYCALLALKPAVTSSETNSKEFAPLWPNFICLMKWLYLENRTKGVKMIATLLRMLDINDRVHIWMQQVKNNDRDTSQNECVSALMGLDVSTWAKLCFLVKQCFLWPKDLLNDKHLQHSNLPCAKIFLPAFRYSSNHIG